MADQIVAEFRARLGWWSLATTRGTGVERRAPASATERSASCDPERRPCCSCNPRSRPRRSPRSRRSPPCRRSFLSRRPVRRPFRQSWRCRPCPFLSRRPARTCRRFHPSRRGRCCLPMFRRFLRPFPCSRILPRGRNPPHRLCSSRHFLRSLTCRRRRPRRRVRPLQPLPPRPRQLRPHRRGPLRRRRRRRPRLCCRLIHPRRHPEPASNRRGRKSGSRRRDREPDCAAVRSPELPRPRRRRYR